MKYKSRFRIALSRDYHLPGIFRIHMAYGNGLQLRFMRWWLRIWYA